MDKYFKEYGYSLFCSMPKIFGYNGFDFFFYSREHIPPHCHVVKAEKGAKFELFSEGGVIEEPHIQQVSDEEFSPLEQRIIKKVVEIYGADMIEKWYQYFNGQKPKFERINALKKRK